MPESRQEHPHEKKQAYKGADSEKGKEKRNHSVFFKTHLVIHLQTT